MTLESSVFFCSCRLLWKVLSLFLYLEEVVVKRQLGPAMPPWYYLADNFANWLLDGSDFVIEIEQILPEKVTDIIFDKFRSDDYSRLFIHQWGARLNAVAHEARDNYPAIEQSTWLYFCYCRLLWRIISEYQVLMLLTGDTSIYYERYQSNIEQFDTFVRLLAAERPTLNSDTEKPWSKIVEFTDSLALEWREIVIKAAEDIRQ